VGKQSDARYVNMMPYNSTNEGLQRVDLNKRGSTACGSQQTRVYSVWISTNEGLQRVDLNKRGSTLYRSQQTRVYIVSISTNEGLHCIDLNKRGSTLYRSQQTRVYIVSISTDEGLQRVELSKRGSASVWIRPHRLRTSSGSSSAMPKSRRTKRTSPAPGCSGAG